MDPETIDPLINALPPAWLEQLQTYAPHVIVWGTLLLALVHVLLPIARRIETWAIATPDPRDDGPARRFVQALEAIAGVSRFVLSWIPRFTIGDPQRAKKRAPASAHIEAPLPWPAPPLASPPPKPRAPGELRAGDRADRVVGCRVCGKPCALVGDTIPADELCTWCREDGRGGEPPIGGALGVALLIVAAALSSIVASGCSARAYGAQADLVALGGIAAAGADEVLVEARARELDAVLELAREECAPAGCDEERAEHHRAELAAAEARWAPVLACRAPVVEALRSWADGISTAIQTATDDVGIALLLRLGVRFVAAYSALVGCVEAAAPDVDLPGLPPALSALVGGAS